MSKKLVLLIVALISLSMVAPLSAKGPNGGNNNQSPITLSDLEIKHIIHMREEEKLARDVYLTLSELYPDASIFENISLSEQRHMDALKNLIIKYELVDPVIDEIGKFSDSDFGVLYEDLVKAGMESYCSALQVGIDIEVLDIDDIELYLIDVVAQDVNRVLNNLLNGSYNHLSAFESQYQLNSCGE